jgi:hypothetical protein
MLLWNRSFVWCGDKAYFPQYVRFVMQCGWRSQCHAYYMKICNLCHGQMDGKRYIADAFGCSCHD